MNFVITNMATIAPKISQIFPQCITIRMRIGKRRLLAPTSSQNLSSPTVVISQTHTHSRGHDRNILQSIIPRYNLTQVRNRIYSPAFVEPLEAADVPGDLDELGDRMFRPVEAMKPSRRLSADYDPLVETLITCCMMGGDRALAKEIVAKSFEKVKLIQIEKYHKAKSDEERQRICCDPVKIFHQAFQNVLPVFTLMPHVRGGTLYQVPVAARPKRAEQMAVKWLRDSAQTKPKNISFWDSMARELIDASNNTGKSVKKKLELHRKCDANKAYAHFIWSR